MIEMSLSRFLKFNLSH